jgi:hypothetical protein
LYVFVPVAPDALADFAGGLVAAAGAAVGVAVSPQALSMPRTSNASMLIEDILVTFIVYSFLNLLLY